MVQRPLLPKDIPHQDASSLDTLRKKNDELEQLIKKLEDDNREKERIISWKDADISHKIRTISKLQDLLAKQTDKAVELEHSKSYKIGQVITYPFRLGQKISQRKPPAESQNSDSSAKTWQQKIPAYTPGVINLGGQLLTFFGKHRSGWGYAVINLAPLIHHNGIYLDTFIERTFVWQTEKIEPIIRPWIGFIHVPPNMPRWLHFEQSNDAIFASDVWKKSLPYCKGLYTLSNYHRKNLEKKLEIPVNALIHPTQQPYCTWHWEQFEKNTERKIVQVGWWLRKLHAIFELPESGYKKIFLNVGSDADFKTFFEKERRLRKAKGVFKDSMYDTATTVNYLPDVQYDQLLSENIMFADLYDASANNLVIECIVRNTPLLINPIEPVVEYLGREYPLYFSSHEEAVQKANDLNLVRQTHEYLKNHPIKEKLTGEFFLKSFKNSKIFKNL